MTVGDTFLLSCEGAPLALAKENLHLELPKEQKYSLKLLETRTLSDTRAEFIATTWASGEQKLANPVLTDGAKRIGLGKIELTVATVIDPKQNPESKPFPPVGPLSVSWPMAVWFTLVATVFVLIAAFWNRVSRSMRRKRLLRLLESNPIAQKPYHQFNKELRRLGREIPSSDTDWALDKANLFLRELESALRWYLARELVIPAFDRSPTELARDLKRKDGRLDKAVRRELVIALQELEKASAAMAGNKILSVGDAQQILELARGVADRIDRMSVKAGA